MTEEKKIQNLQDLKKNPKDAQLSLKEYKALQEKEAKKFKLSIPLPIKIFLSIPLVVIAIFGLVYIPFTAYQNATADSPSAGTKNVKKKATINK